MYWTEQAIKNALDGTFTRMDRVTGKSVTKQVEKDYRPTHKPPGENAAAGGKEGGRKSFLRFEEAEDHCIIAMHAKGYSNWRIGKLLGRKRDTIYRRIVLLKEKGRISA